MTISEYTYKWFKLSITVLGIGGGLAFFLGMSRSPIADYFPQDFFYYALAGHVINAILFFLMSFTIVLWSVRFKKTVPTIANYFAITGAALVLVSVFRAEGVMVINNYVPTIIDPIFFSGLGFFFFGFSINIFYYLKEAFDIFNSQDVLDDTIATTVLIATVMFLSLIIALMINRYGETPNELYERLYWTPGHIQQILNGTLLVYVWHCLRGKLGHESLEFTKILKFSNRALLVSAILLFIFPIFLDPISRTSKILSESVYAFGLGIPVFIHGWVILKNTNKDWSNIAFSSMVFSIAIYTVGVLIAYSGFGNDLRIPAHYHGTVTSLALAMMGYAYFVTRGRFKAVAAEKIAALQPFLYGGGMLLLIAGMFLSGLGGAPRKTHGTGFTEDPFVLFSLGLVGVGTVLAVLGGIFFVGYTLLTIIKGVRNDRE